MTKTHADPTSFSAVPNIIISSTVLVYAFLLASPSIPLRAVAVYVLLHRQSKVTPLLTYSSPLEKQEKQLPNTDKTMDYLPLHLL